MLKFSHILQEASEYEDTEFIDYSEINLSAEYKKLNTILFNNELPEDIELRWVQTRDGHGQLKTTRNKRTRQILRMVLSISKFRQLTYRVFKDILAHEMIHVKLMNNWIDDNHGSTFKREMNRINDMGLGFNVTVTASLSHLPMTDNRPVSRRIVIILETGGVRGPGIITMTAAAYMAEKDYLHQYYQRRVDGGAFPSVTITTYESTDPRLREVALRRNFNNGIPYNLWDDKSITALTTSPMSKYIEVQKITKQ